MSGIVLHVTPPAPEHETLFDIVVEDATTRDLLGQGSDEELRPAGSRGLEQPASNGADGDNGFVSSRHAVTAAGLNPRYGFETFVKGQSNQFALAAAQRVAEVPARSYNPLFIYGAAGLGKTHLLHAIGHYVDQNYSHYEIRYVSTETFLNEYVDAIRSNATAQFKRRYRDVDVLLIDDIQFMEGKEGLQEEFFHTPTPSRPSRTGCGVGSSGASSRTSSRRTSKPASRSCVTRPSGTTPPCRRRCSSSSPSASPTTSVSSRAR
jgi:hypothetical protein